MNLSTLPFIVLVSYMVGELFKIIVKNKKGLTKLISLIPSLIGSLLGIIIYLDDPNILGASNIYVAMEIVLLVEQVLQVLMK